jgi:hypothetical protein
MTEILLNDIERLNYRKAQNWLVAMNKIDLYDFLADTGADPWGKPGADTRGGLFQYALEHVDLVGPCILLDWIEQTGAFTHE